MISILIPVYNVEVVPLVNELANQLNNLSAKGEILIFDDHSSSRYRELNKAISNVSHVTYKELDKNYGRTVIRQLLASEAKNEWLLFIDSDSRIIHSDFLHRYFSSFKNGVDVIVGGRVYPSRPTECTKSLHWKYGVKRESVKGNKAVFHTNNFCIKRETFMQLNFPDFLKQYGHEDSWMGIALEHLDKKILHIDNAVEHVHVEDTRIFLEKTQHALENLLLLKTIVDTKTLKKHVSLFKAYSDIKQFHLNFALNIFFNAFKNRIEHNLNSCNPSLFYFDLYRLYHFFQMSKKNP